MLAFWTQGFEATSISDLVDATGLNRGSIYGAFGDKRGLFVESLRHYDRVHRRTFLKRIAGDNLPREAIIAAFEAAASPRTAERHPAGCLLVNTALEVSPHDPAIRDLVNTSLQAVEEFFCEMIICGQADNTIPARLDAGATAKALLGLFLGLRVMTRTKLDDAAVSAVIVQARTLLT